MSTDDVILQIENTKVSTAILRQIKEQKKGWSRICTRKITEADALHMTSLSFENMEIEDLDFLVYFPNLDMLTLKNVSGLQNIEGIRSCKKLESLFLYDTYIKSLLPIADCVHLEVLDYAFTTEKRKMWDSSELTVLAQLPKLTDLVLVGTGLTDVSVFTKFRALTALDLSDNPLVTIAPLKEIVQLKSLVVEDCGLTELEDIEDFPALDSLIAQGNKFPQELKEKYQTMFKDIHEFGI